MGSDQGRGTGEIANKSALAGIAWPFRRWSAQPSCRNAARTGFDWPDIEGPKAKIREELDEIAAALPEELEEEVGDLLRGRQLRTLSQDRTGRGAEESEPEVRAALPCNREGAGFAEMTLDQMEELWLAAKQAPADA